MSAGQGVHGPTRVVLHFVVELGEARGLRGQDVHLLFDTTNAARQRTGWVKVACGCGPLLPSQSAITSGRLRPNSAGVLSAINQSSPCTMVKGRPGGNMLNKDCPFSGTKASR